MIFHYCIGLHSEVTPPQKVVGEGTRNTAVPERARSTMHGSYLSEAIYVPSLLYLTITGAKTTGGQMS